MDGLKARLAAAERKTAEADGGGLPTFYSEEHLAELLERLGLPHSPAALAAGHRWPAVLLHPDDWRL